VIDILSLNPAQVVLQLGLSVVTLLLQFLLGGLLDGHRVSGGSVLGITDRLGVLEVLLRDVAQDALGLSQRIRQGVPGCRLAVLSGGLSLGGDVRWVARLPGLRVDAPLISEPDGVLISVLSVLSHYLGLLTSSRRRIQRPRPPLRRRRCPPPRLRPHRRVPPRRLPRSHRPEHRAPRRF